MSKTTASTGTSIGKWLYGIFGRKTSGGKYIPELDGIRFFALLSVVMYHVYKHYFEKNVSAGTHDNSVFIFAHAVMGNFSRGLELFFAISGFILAVPFASFYIKKTGKPRLIEYFLRRVTRLEPPYILSLILFFILNYVTHHNSLEELVPHFIASFFYCHNIVYPGILPLINGVTWSLEVEVQFYILAPLLAYIFIFRDKLKRRFLLIGLIIFFIVLNNTVHFGVVTILNYFHFFFIGFLIADYYVEGDFNSLLKTNLFFEFLIGVVFLAGLFYFPNGKAGGFILPLSIFFFVYMCLFSRFWKAVANIKTLTVIGGMCYSVYLLHVYIIALADRVNIGQYIHAGPYAKFFIHSTICLALILFISSFFFLLIEKPCMDKNWPKMLVNKFRRRTILLQNN